MSEKVFLEVEACHKSWGILDPFPGASNVYQHDLMHFSHLGAFFSSQQSARKKK